MPVPILKQGTILIATVQAALPTPTPSGSGTT